MSVNRTRKIEDENRLFRCVSRFFPVDGVDPQNHDRLNRDFRIKGAAGPGRDTADRIGDIHAFNNFTENGVSENRSKIGDAMVEIVIVAQIDEPLGLRGILILPAGHRDGTTAIFKSVIAFIWDRVAGCALIEILRVAAALNHITAHNPVKNRPVEMTASCIFKKIRDSLRRGLRVQLNNNIAL